jgi:hypothetical protein
MSKLSILRQLPPWLLLLLCILYVLSPLDILPDFLGLPGRFDDLLVAVGTLYYIYSGSKRIPRADRSGGDGEAPGGRRGREGRNEAKGGSSERASQGGEDPYTILGLSRSAGLEEIRRRYKEKLLQYHPDRVQHLGREFEVMAEGKTKEITEAYQRILKERGERS